MDASPLAQLSGELRNEIYALVLHVHEGIGIDASGDSIKAHATPPLQLTRVCRRIRNETLNLFYALITFTVYTHHLEGTVEAFQWRALLEEWSMVVGKERTKQIMTINFDFGSSWKGKTRSMEWPGLRSTVSAICHPQSKTTFCLRVPLLSGDAGGADVWVLAINADSRCPWAGFLPLVDLAEEYFRYSLQDIDLVADLIQFLANEVGQDMLAPDNSSRLSTYERDLRDLWLALSEYFSRS